MRDWLFPISSQIDFNNPNQWFTALEINFDPLSIWRHYDRPTLMIFSQYDDSTPTEVVISKVKALNKKNIKPILIPQAQHIGLQTASVCQGDISTLNQFNPMFFKEITEWLSKL